MSAVGGGDARHVVTESRVIAAPREVLFDLVADPAMHPGIDCSGTVRAQAAGGPARLGPGVRFGMSMRMGCRTESRTAWSSSRRAAGSHGCT